MSIAQYIAENNPILNVPDLFNLYHSNPLGINPIVQLIFIFLVVEVMGVFNYQIRYKNKMQFYPVLYSLLAVAEFSIYYYCFQSGLGSYGEYQITNAGTSVSKPIIAWFCSPSIVGWGVAIPCTIALIHVTYTLMSAVMQTAAQLTVEAKMIEGKKWKEWKAFMLLMMLGVLVIGVCSYIPDFNIIASWTILITLILMTVFVIVKMVLDTIRSHSFKWGFFIGLTFWIGSIAAFILILDCFRGLVILLVFFMAFFSRIKARKKK